LPAGFAESSTLNPYFFGKLPAHFLGQKDAPMAWVGAPPSSLKPGHFFCAFF
jgi:hypothetical protein